ncbi:helix-turn-helix domain-containing protein [Flagellimonas lutimaris]|uniref:helix-turn-helix domain-containing protein n=1 Tax=Flagellimonas lutimaris TaxID=475082 RepID=UPI003F5CD7A7
MDNLVTIKQASEILACTPEYVRQLCKEKRLTPVSTIHPRYYFDMDEVLEFQKTMKPTYGSNKK